MFKPQPIPGVKLFLASTTIVRVPDSSRKGLKSPYHRADVRMSLPTLQTHVVNLHLKSSAFVHLFTVCKLYFPGLLVSTDEGSLFHYSCSILLYLVP